MSRLSTGVTDSIISASTYQSPVTWSMSCWYKPSVQPSGNYSKIISISSGGSSPSTLATLNWDHTVGTYQKAWYFLAVGGNYNVCTYSSSINNGTWYHLGATWDGTILRIYYNGVQDNTL